MSARSWIATSRGAQPRVAEKARYALELAQADFELRKDVYTLDALAWALYKNGRLEEALELNPAFDVRQAALARALLERSVPITRAFPKPSEYP